MSAPEEKNYLRIGRSSNLKNPKEKRLYRALETLHGILCWATLVLAVALSFFEPFFVAVFIILFDLYWFFRAIYLVFHLRSDLKRMKENEKINWLDKIQQLAINNQQLAVIGKMK